MRRSRRCLRRRVTLRYMKMWNDCRCETQSSVWAATPRGCGLYLFGVLWAGYFLRYCDGESDEGLIDGGWWMMNGEWWCLARMYFMTRWWMEVPKLTRCCCYSEVEAEWPDLKQGRRREEVKWRNVCMLNNVGGWEREKKYIKKQKSWGLEMEGTYFVYALNDDYQA